MFERFWILKIGGGIYLTMGVGTMIARPLMRKMTGWEDWESHDVNQQKLDEFIAKQDGKTAIEVEEGENYF